MSGRDLPPQSLDAQAAEGFERLFALAPVGLLQVVASGRRPWIVAVNGRGEEILGYPASALVGRDLDLLLPATRAAGVAPRLDAVAAGGELRWETSLVRAGGQPFPARLRAFPLGDGGGILALSIEDISAELRARSRLAAIDEERRRIAHELHDTLAQDLAAIRFNAAVWKDLVERDPARLRQELAGLQDELKTEIDATRRAIHALRPAELDEAGFTVALRHLAQDMEARYGYAVDLQMEGSARSLPAELELPLLRMIQEALNNAGQHAEAGRVALQLDLSDPERLRLSVRDDGRGLGPDALSDAMARGHLGLVQMAERAESYGGRIEVGGQQGEGSLLRIEIPLPAA